MAGVGRLPFSTPWLLTGLILFAILIVIAAAGYTPTLRRQIQVLDAGGPNSRESRRLAARGARLGILLAIIGVSSLFVMVTKPALWR